MMRFVNKAGVLACRDELRNIRHTTCGLLLNQDSQRKPQNMNVFLILGRALVYQRLEDTLKFVCTYSNPVVHNIA